ncbi:MAG TPA: hypothetical protein DCX29_01620 [Hyphomonas sp.]|nr:hypothetical protein [Hyphomonas sp.]
MFGDFVAQLVLSIVLNLSNGPPHAGRKQTRDNECQDQLAWDQAGENGDHAVPLLTSLQSMDSQSRSASGSDSRAIVWTATVLAATQS